MKIFPNIKSFKPDRVANLNLSLTMDNHSLDNSKHYKGILQETRLRSKVFSLERLWIKLLAFKCFGLGTFKV